MIDNIGRHEQIEPDRNDSSQNDESEKQGNNIIGEGTVDPKKDNDDDINSGIFDGWWLIFLHDRRGHRAPHLIGF